MRCLVFIFAAGVCLGAQAAEPSGGVAPEVMLLARIRQHMLEHLRRQPNYTCVETVERSRRAGSTRKFHLQDTLRLEVALVDGKEMFGWPGAKKFEDTDLRNIVSEGAIGNGNFALHARSIFEGVVPIFEYRGEWPIDGVPAVRYDFRVSRMLSGYKIRVSDKEAIVGYHGSFYADPKSLDLRRIDVIADDVPAELGLSYAGDRMDYGRMRIGDGEFLLPVASELSMIDLSGQESRNQVRFASCRQFTGESVLSFGDPPPSAGPAPEAVEQIELPSGLTVTLSLLDELDTGAAAVGDPVRARLQHDLKRHGLMLFPKGTVATGRITRLDKHDDYTILGLEFSELASSTARASLIAKLGRVAGVDLLQPSRRLVRGPDPRPGEGIVTLRAGRVHLFRGILMYWRT